MGITLQQIGVKGRIETRNMASNSHAKVSRVFSAAPSPFVRSGQSERCAMPDTNEHDKDALRWWETQQENIVQR